jgi:hypothetical protein
MLPLHHIESLIQFCSQDQKDIILELRNLVLKAAPDATEEAHSNWLSYYHTGRGGPVSAGICLIGIHPDHIRLAFIHGAFLNDPLKLLEGGSKYKKFIRISSYTSAPWDALMELLMESSHFDPYSLARL